jgi:hypothetical protein
MQKLERSAGVDDRGVVGHAASADERPVAERWAQALSPVDDKSRQDVERCLEIGIDCNPPRALGFKNGSKPRLNGSGNCGKRSRYSDRS